MKQYDETIGQNIMSNEEMVNAIEILKGELPADDTSSFSFKKGDNGNDEPDDAITYDKLSACMTISQERVLLTSLTRDRT